MGIPISFLGAFWLMPLFGVSINMISLFALIMALGIWAQPLVAAAQRTSAWLGDPALYIQAVLGG